jgi:hypothetical protein
MPRPNIQSLAANSRLRASALGLTEHFTESEILALLEKSNYCCLSCGRSFDVCVLSADHVVPLAGGGSNTIDNIQILCKYCNSKKHVKIIDYRNSDFPLCAVLDRQITVRASKKTTTVENQKQLAFRVPADVYENLEKEAIKNGRSINSQLIQILKERYTTPPTP